MLQSLLGGRLSLLELVFMFVSYAVVILVMLPVHEMAHAFVADRLGDKTARWNGRLTMNPFAHLDIFGTIMIFLFGIGFAKPVPVNPRNFKNPKVGMALTALAGPVSNLLMAVLSIALFRLVSLLPVGNTVLVLAWIILINVFAGVNIGLAVFNLLPITPLDGFRIASLMIPDKWIYYVDRYQQFITIGVLLLLFTGVLDTPLYFLRTGIGTVIGALFGFPHVFEGYI